MSLIWTDDFTTSEVAASEGPPSAGSPDRCCKCGEASAPRTPFSAALLDVLEELREDAPERLPRWLVWVGCWLAALWGLVAL
jgi:hypothetical protein